MLEGMPYGSKVALARCLWAIIKCMRSLCFDLMYIKLINHVEYARLKGLLASAGNELNAYVANEKIRKEVYDGTV